MKIAITRTENIFQYTEACLVSFFSRHCGYYFSFFAKWENRLAQRRVGGNDVKIESSNSMWNDANYLFQNASIYVLYFNLAAPIIVSNYFIISDQAFGFRSIFEIEKDAANEEWRTCE